MKALTEDEIRAKLYGHLLNQTDSTGTIQVKKQKLTPQSTGMKPVAPNSPDDLQKSAVLNLSKPAPTTPEIKTDHIRPDVSSSMSQPADLRSDAEKEDFDQEEEILHEEEVSLMDEETVIEDEEEVLEEEPPVVKDRPESKGVNFPKVTSHDLFSGAKPVPVPPPVNPAAQPVIKMDPVVKPAPIVPHAAKNEPIVKPAPKASVTSAASPVVSAVSKSQVQTKASLGAVKTGIGQTVIKPAAQSTFRVSVKMQSKPVLSEWGKKFLSGSASLGRHALNGGVELGKNLSQIDYRGPWFKRFLYGAGALLMIGLLFVSIHLLNIRREAAMKNPPKVQKKISKPTPVMPTPAVSLNSEAPVLSHPTESAPAETAKLKSAADAALTSVKESSAKPAANGKFGIQVATYVAQEDSDRLIKRIENTGMPVFMKQFQRGEGRRFYSVFLGPFETYPKAQNALEKFKKQKDVSQPFQDAFIRTV